MTCLTLTMNNSIRHSSSWVTNGKAEAEATLGVQHLRCLPGSGNVEALRCHSATVATVPVTIHRQILLQGIEKSTEGPYPASSHSPIMPLASACVMRSRISRSKEKWDRVSTTTQNVAPPSCRRVACPVPVSAGAPAHRRGSGPRGASLAHKEGAALLRVSRSLVAVYSDGLFVRHLTGRVREGRQRQGDSLHLPLTHLLLALLFQVLPPVRKRKHSGCASIVAWLN